MDSHSALGPRENTYETSSGSVGGDLLLDRGDFQIRLARSRARETCSRTLVDRLYAARGYKTGAHGTPSNPNRITLQACDRSHVFGTLSVCFDSHAGLAADSLYSTEIDRYRAKGASVAELTRLAVDPQFGSKEVLGALFHLAYIVVGPLRDVTDVFIEVNPRHAPFYRRMLHFQQLGECKLCTRVAAPAVLLHVAVSHVGEQAAIFGGHQRESRSLFPYFCSPEEEDEMIERVLSLYPRPARHVEPS